MEVFLRLFGNELMVTRGYFSCSFQKIRDLKIRGREAKTGTAREE